MILWTFLCPDSCITSVGSTFLFADFPLFTAKVKTVHRRFSFPRVTFVRRLCRPLLDILVVRHSKKFQCNGSYILWIVSWTSFGLSFIEFEVLLPCGSFDKVFRLPLNIFLCAPCSLVTRNGSCSWTIPCFKALLPSNFPRDPFQTELEHLPHLKERSIRLVAHAFPF